MRKEFKMSSVFSYYIYKEHPPQKQKKNLRPNNLSNYSGANHSLFPFTYQHRPPQLHLGSSCFLISVI